MMGETPYGGIKGKFQEVTARWVENPTCNLPVRRRMDNFLDQQTIHRQSTE